jgi:hypothetical protein
VEHRLRFPNLAVDETNLPDLFYLWSHFINIADTRKKVGERISYRELWAWATLNGVSLVPWEVQAIVEMDRLACAIEATQRPRGDVAQTLRQGASRGKRR